MVLYSAVLLAVLLLAAPWWLFRMLTADHYREGLAERLGVVPQPLRALAAGKRVIWLHAVSVGEVLAASSLIAELEAELQTRPGPGWEIVLSTTTRTGQQLARERFGAHRVFYFPLDLARAVRSWLDALQPELLILTESELWPRLLHECARKAIPVAVINARVSDRSFRRAMRFQKIWRRMTRPVSLWLAQSEDDRSRLIQLGAPASSVSTSGNLKYDTPSPQETPLTAAVRAGAAGRTVVIAGSTVHYGTTPEEGIVLDAMRRHIWTDRPDVLLILAPRHPQRFAEAGVLAAQAGTMVCATDLLIGPQGYRIHERVLVVDTIGDLAALYRLADVAFIGGSLLPHGGHNPLEAARFSVPVIMGPHISNFRDIVSALQADDAIILLQGTEPGDLGNAIAGLLARPEQARALGERGCLVYERQRGATHRTLDAILPFLERRPHNSAKRAARSEDDEERTLR